MQLLVLIAFIIAVKLFIRFVKWIVNKLRSPTPVRSRTACKDRTTVTIKYNPDRERKKREKERKLQFERSQAISDIEHLKQQRTDYLRLYDIYSAQSRAAKNDKQRITAEKSILVLNDKIRNIDKKLATAYYKSTGD